MKLKYKLLLIPELYLVVATVYYWILTSNLLNPVAIALLVILGYLFITKNQTLGLLISGVFIALNGFLILALLSEYSEFEATAHSGNELLIVGSLFIGLNLIVASLMFRKYLKMKMATT